MAATPSEGGTHRRQRTHTLNARDGIQPGAKLDVDALRRRGRGDSLAARNVVTHALSARNDIHTGAKQSAAHRRDGGGTHERLAMLLWPPLTVAQLRPRKNRHALTKADADANADVKHAWQRHCVKDRPANGSAHTPKVPATAFVPAKIKQQHGSSR